MTQSYRVLGVVFALLLSVAPVAKGEALKCTLVPQLFEMFLRTHYSYDKLTTRIKNQTVDQFVKRLDSSKTMLLQGDVNNAKGKVRELFSTIKYGNCKNLEAVNKLLLTRAKENEDFVRGFLGPKYKLDESVELILDPEKRKYPTTKAERFEVLKKIVHFQVSNFLLADMKMDEAKKNLIHRYELVSKRIAEKVPNELVEEFAEAFALALDPHSSFLSRDSVEDFQIQMQLSLEGIGASLSSQNGFTVIEALIKGGGAEKSEKLEPKDKIIAVAQENEKPVSIIDMELRDVVKLIRGKKGTKVRLTILRQAEKTKTLEVTIVRDKIDIEESAAKIYFTEKKVGEKKYKLGVIDLPSFYGGGKGGRISSTDVRKLLEEAKKAKVDGIVLDLSRNGGGLLEEAVRISGLFINRGAVVATKNTREKVEVLEDEDDGLVYSGPLVVLTSRLSASASEILAGALQDYNRGLIIGGGNTFGKGSVQTFLQLPMGVGAMKVTTGLFFLPGGKSTQRLGVPSDITLPSVFDEKEIGESALDYALAAQSIKPFLSREPNVEGATRWKPLEKKLVKTLASKSEKRVKKEEKFEEIRKSLKEREKNKDKVILADLRKKSIDDKKEDEDKDKAKDKKKKKTEAEEQKEYLESVLVNESLNILADLIDYWS